MRLFFLLLFICPSIIFSQDLVEYSISHDNLDREFLMSVPTDYDGSKALALVFNFHGYTSNAGQQMWYSEIKTIAEREGFIVVHPEGTLFQGIPHWNVGGFSSGSTTDDVGFTEAMIDFISDNYNIDQSKIYATGMSNGGYMSYLLACQLGEKFAAIASVTGSMTPETYDDCSPSHPTPILEIHGTADQTVPYEGADYSLSIDAVLEYWNNYNNCNNLPSVIEFADIDPNDGSTATHFIYGDCDNNITTEHIKISGGAHTWPGAFFGGEGTNYDINASEEIWKFFSKYDINGLLETFTTDTHFSTSVNIYPNPTTGIINVESTSIQDFKLYNLLGVELSSGTLTTEIQTLNLENLQEGFYFLKTNTQSLKFQLLK